MASVIIVASVSDTGWAVSDTARSASDTGWAASVGTRRLWLHPVTAATGAGRPRTKLTAAKITTKSRVSLGW